MRWLDSTSNYVNMSWSKLWDTVEDGVAWCAAGLRRNRYILAIEQLNYYHNVLAVMFRNYELYDACLIPQSCLTLCELMAPLSVGILQTRILEWVFMPPPGDLPHSGIKPSIAC